ncbi:(d)CMP kinase [Pelagibacteraceae bacterium]|nr:(d)CMP kinase [Pelagibacteraceae bacterium]
MKLKKNIKILIAADGGAASGKTTAAKLISKKYGLKFLSSGLLYRYLSYKLLSTKKLMNKTTQIKKICKSITLSKLKNKKLFDQKVTFYSSKIAKSKKIRIELKKFQKTFAKQNHVCIEGRDIGSVICPQADIKFFFKCGLKVRAKRRWDEYRKANPRITLIEVQKALKLRDYSDINRKYSPLRVLKDSIVIDTTKLSIKEVLSKISKVVEKRLLLKYGRNFKEK